MQTEQMMIIDGMLVPIEGERNLLDVITKTGVDMPVFCYHTDLSIYGACRMCMVEDEKGRLMAACSTIPKAGMVIKTNTARLFKYRKNILELLLASHCRDCTTCSKSGKCTLQKFATQFGITSIKYTNDKTEPEIDASSYSIVRDASKCILCGDCVRECREVQRVGAIDFINRGSEAKVGTAFNMPLIESSCVHCGQCAAHCPTGALVIKDDTQNVWDMLHDPKVFVTCEIAPAVRVGIGADLGVADDENAMGRIVASLHRLGFDQVYDSATGADLTVIEEANEFVERVKKGEKLPLFTSCCPAWIQFIEKKYPEFMPNVSTCRSPMSMFSAVIKDHFRDNLPEGKTKHYHVAVMPCTAKKFEAHRPEFKTEAGPNTDDVITTQELIKMIRQMGIRFNELDPEAVDTPYGTMSGAGVIFGITGGVTEAVVRMLAQDKSRASLRSIETLGLRGLDDFKETWVPFGDRNLHIAVTSGLANAEKILLGIKNGEMDFDLVEVMACRGGCISGAGQPYIPQRYRINRGKGLYDTDRTSTLKRSQDNQLIEELYNTVLKGRTHELLHVEYAVKEQ